MPGNRKGIANQPRERMLRKLEEMYPDWCPVVRMVELAESARDQMLEEQAEWDAYKANPESVDEPPPRVTKADKNMVAGMYERPAKYLLPQLRSTEVAVGGLDGGGPVRVTFLREPPPEPEA